MSDAFKPIRPGQPVPVYAESWNAMLGAGRAFQANQLNQLSGPLTTSRSGDIVRVRNDSGSDIEDRFGVLAINGPLFLPSESLNNFQQEVTFSGVTPTYEFRGRFVVLNEPCPASTIARGWISGVTMAQVDVLDEEHTWADIKNNERGYLVSGGEGSAQILWRSGETPYDGPSYYEGYGSRGLQWAIVRLGRESVERWAKLPSGGIAAGATGTVEFYTDGTFAVLTGETSPATNYWSDAANPTSRKCIVKRSGTIWTVDRWGCT